ncbi:chemotaxis protein CheW [Parerythrobacter aurantius]|uniref:chemotaxis protein CheW n=1 Tax=Parerythrobacter aurantius TaxID=3127706 RepID=UPI00325558B9
MIGELLLVATVGGRNIALPAADVASVSELERVTTVPRAPAWIEGIGAQRSRALTVVNCHRAIGLPGEAATAGGETRCIVVKIDEHLYALRADAILDVTIAQSDVTPVPTGLGNEWRSVATGVIETSFGPAVMIDVRAVIAGPQRQAA